MYNEWLGIVGPEEVICKFSLVICRSVPERQVLDKGLIRNQNQNPNLSFQDLKS